MGLYAKIYSPPPPEGKGRSLQKMLHLSKVYSYCFCFLCLTVASKPHPSCSGGSFWASGVKYAQWDFVKISYFIFLQIWNFLFFWRTNRILSFRKWTVTFTDVCTSLACTFLWVWRKVRERGLRQSLKSSEPILGCTWATWEHHQGNPRSSTMRLNAKQTYIGLHCTCWNSTGWRFMESSRNQELRSLFAKGW